MHQSVCDSIMHLDNDFFHEILKDGVEPRMKRHVVKKALSCNGHNLRFFPEYHAEYYMVSIAVASTPSYIKYTDMKNLKKIAMIAVKGDGMCLAHIPCSIRGDVNIIKAALKQNGLSLQYCTKQVRADIKMVKIAMTNNWLSLQYSSIKLTPQIEDFIKTIGGGIIHDRAILNAVCNIRPDMVKYASYTLKLK